MSIFVSFMLYKVQKRVGQREVGGARLQRDMHMVAVVVGLVGAGHSNFCLGCTIGLAKLRKCYSHLIGASFLE